MDNKKVLLIGGTGAMGYYASRELARLGYSVDVITLEKCENTDNIQYYTQRAEFSVMKEFLSGRRYKTIVDFIYHTSENVKSYLELLAEHTEQIIFLSSYRVYADKMHPIKEDAPQLVDFYSKEEMINTKQEYPYIKSECEKIIRSSDFGNKVTIVRPVISFWHKNLSFITIKAPTLISRAGKKPILVPKEAQNVIAGYSFSSNCGKLISHLVGKPGAFGETFTLGKDDNLTWGEIAQMFTQALGAEFVWVDADTFLKYSTPDNIAEYYGLWNDRLLNRDIDISKVLSVTGLDRNDLMSTKEAIDMETGIILSDSKLYENIIAMADLNIDANMDSYFK